MSEARIVRGATLTAVPWRNGMGTTRDVREAAGGPGDWQISIADLTRDAPFSDFTGMDRTFTIIEGTGVELVFGGHVVPCPPLVPIRFPGAAAPACRLPAGPGRAFNVIVDRTRFRAEIAVLRLAPGSDATPDERTTLLHCVAGRLSTDAGTLDAGDTLIGATDVHADGDAATLIQVAITRTGLDRA